MRAVTHPGGTTAPPDSTLADVHPPQLRRTARLGRRLVLGLVAILVLCGATGVMGVHSSTVATSDGEWSLSVRYPRIARAGWDVPWQVKVTHPGGFGKSVELAVNASYFDIYETQGFHPEPSSETRDGSFVYLTFDAPPGDVFLVDYDAYIQPSAQLGRRGEVRLMVHDQPQLTVSYHTWLWP